MLARLVVRVDKGGLEVTVPHPLLERAEGDTGRSHAGAECVAKIVETLPGGGTRVVHRMGDLGYFDAEGRLWFCGRKGHRVVTATGTLCTEQVEPVFNVHPDVRRTALVGVGAKGAQTPVLCVELEAGTAKTEQTRIVDELRHIGEGHVHTGRIDRFLFHPGFPVDIRHNAKIGRETLAVWAAKHAKDLA